jgi:putative mycofactocin binding protein MftB
MSEFDADQPWQLAPKVALRPEPFGALAYHYSTRRLSFLRSQKLVAVVESLSDHPSARAACEAAGVEMREWATYNRALASLARSSMITRRSADS